MSSRPPTDYIGRLYLERGRERGEGEIISSMLKEQNLRENTVHFSLSFLPVCLNLKIASKFS